MRIRRSRALDAQEPNGDLKRLRLRARNVPAACPFQLLPRSMTWRLCGRLQWLGR